MVSLPQEPAAAASTAIDAPSAVSGDQNQLEHSTTSGLQAGSQYAQHGTSQSGRDSDESDSEQ